MVDLGRAGLTIHKALASFHLCPSIRSLSFPSSFPFQRMQLGGLRELTGGEALAEIEFFSETLEFATGCDIHCIQV